MGMTIQDAHDVVRLLRHLNGSGRVVEDVDLERLLGSCDRLAERAGRVLQVEIDQHNDELERALLRAGIPGVVVACCEECADGNHCESGDCPCCGHDAWAYSDWRDEGDDDDVDERDDDRSGVITVPVDGRYV